MDYIDASALKFAQIIQSRPARQTITEKYEGESGENRGRYASQRAHMATWFANGGTPGPRSRATAPGTAGATYGRLQSPAGLLWIAEAFGEDREVVRAAAKDALMAPRRPGWPSEVSGIIRRAVPWHRVAELASQAPAPTWPRRQTGRTTEQLLEEILEEYRGA